MRNEIQQINEILIGFDIEPEHVQISWYDKTMAEPETITQQVGVENYKMPFCLFYQMEKKSFLFGESALQAASQDEQGYFIVDLWKNAMLRKRFGIAERSFSYIELMRLYFERLIQLACTISDCQEIGGLAFTMRELDQPEIEVLQEVSHGLAPDKTPVLFKTYEECFASYLMNQSQELYSRDCVLLYFKNGCLDVFHLSIGKRFQPYPIQLERKRIDELSYLQDQLPQSLEEKQKLDRDFSKTAQQLFGRLLISTVFLIGDGFDGEWLDDALKFLCRGRRVFQGKNLFTKGACYYIMEENIGRRSFFYQGRHHVDWLIRMNVWENGENKQMLISNGKNDWYQVCRHFVCLLDQCQEITLEIFRENEFAKRRLETLALEPFPKRPNYAVKAEIDIRMTSPNQLKISVKDMGMGEFYESSGLVWEKEIELET